MKKGSQKEEEKKAHQPEKWVSYDLFALLKKARILKEKKGVTPQQQVIDLLVKQDISDPTSQDMYERGLNVPYTFWQAERFPSHTARVDVASSMGIKTKELQRIGAPSETVKTFRQIGDPVWGRTFRGVRFQGRSLQYEFHRRNTYTPFKQELNFDMGPNGEFSWKYAFTLYSPDSLYFWTPNDTMYVNTPEFKHGYWNWENIMLSGEIDAKGKLVFKDIHFGDMVATTGVPNYTVKSFGGQRVTLERLRDGFENKSNFYFDIYGGRTIADLVKFVRQNDAVINTNPLFRFKARGN